MRPAERLSLTHHTKSRLSVDVGVLPLAGFNQKDLELIGIQDELSKHPEYGR